MTGPEARALCAQLRLPAGWHIESRVVRHFRWRDSIALVAFHDSMPVMSWPPAYAVEGQLAIAVLWVEAQPRPMVVTADAEGWVTDISEVA